MCGIVGYTGYDSAASRLLEGLKCLEYRGYDSSGIALIGSEGTTVYKKEGRICKLEKSLENLKLKQITGIGHTRWATHGKPSDENAHPHRAGKFTLVHNGIIENFLELKNSLNISEYKSETDTEVIAHLLNKEFNGDVMQALKKTCDKLIGSYALCVIYEGEPNCIYAARKDSPLIIGKGEGENFIASDIPALLSKSKEMYILNDREFAVVTPESITIFDNDLNIITKPIIPITMSSESAKMGNYESFMLKEINEIPSAIISTVKVYAGEKGILKSVPEKVFLAKRIYIIGCGSAYHAGLIGKQLIEKNCVIPVSVEIASEFRYNMPIVNGDTLCIFISQSGETADTLAALKECKKCGATTIAVTNVETSSITRICDYICPTVAGPEIAVATTKAYVCQVAVMYLISEHIKNMQSGKNINNVCAKLLQMASHAKEYILSANLDKIAQEFKKLDHAFFIGRGQDFYTSLEGSLKLKEISYIHSEAYPAGELKHGTLALVEKGTLVIAIITDRNLLDKTLNAVHEVRARGASVMIISQFESLKEQSSYYDNFILLPAGDDMYMPLLSVIPTQLLTYYISKAKGLDPDKPRNLAKSVTVE